MKDEQRELLKVTLEVLLEQLDASERRANDPVELVWRYEEKADRELAALCASCVAYGRVALVKDAGERIMEPLGLNPAARLLELDDEELEALYDGYVYRMTRGEDVVDLLRGVRELLVKYGTLDAAYGAQPGESHKERASNFVQAIRAGRKRDEVARGLKYLLSDPGDGSTSKRLHLFFRWVARGPDEIDLGLWETLDPSELIMPLDTHTSRICRYIGLGARKSVDGKAADEITESLLALDPEDPLRFDFAICHLGISKGCIHTRSEEHCPRCPLESICTLE